MTYVDVTGDPDAPRHSGISASSIADLAGRAVTELGWFAFIPPGSGMPHVAWIGRTHDRSTLVALGWLDGRERATLWSLAQDGRILITDEKPGWAMWLRLRWGLRVKRRGVIVTHADGDFSSLAALHAAKAQQCDFAPVPDLDMVAYHAMCRRVRELMLPRLDRQRRISEWLVRTTFLVLSAGWVAASIVARETLGWWALLTGLLGVFAARQTAPIAEELGFWYLGALLARGLEGSEQRPAAAQIADVRSIEPGMLPRTYVLADGERAPAPERLRLPRRELIRARRMDALIAGGGAMFTPAFGIALSLHSGLLGIIVALATVFIVGGAYDFLAIRLPDQAIRARVLPNLVSAEIAAGVNRENPVTRMEAFITIVMGSALLALAANIDTSPPSPAWVTAALGVIGAGYVASALIQVRVRHSTILPSE